MFDIDRLYSFSRVDVCVGAKSADADDDDESQNDDDDDIDDDEKLITNDCIDGDDDECDDHRYAAMCQLALWRIYFIFPMTCCYIVIVECTCVHACALA